MKPEIRGVKFVDWRVIEENVCQRPECMVEIEPGKYNGLCMHRHTSQDCRVHKFCIADRLEEKVPAKESLPQPLPFTIKPLPDEENYYEVSRPNIRLIVRTVCRKNTLIKWVVENGENQESLHPVRKLW